MRKYLLAFPVLMFLSQPGNAQHDNAVNRCSKLSGAYLIDIYTDETKLVLSSRSVLSLNQGGTASATDSSQVDDQNVPNFGGQLGAWDCSVRSREFATKMVNFSYPSGSGVARAEHVGRVRGGQVEGVIHLQTYDFDLDPLDDETEPSFMADFPFDGVRITVE
jgi:hypothetical protein